MTDPGSFSIKDRLIKIPCCFARSRRASFLVLVSLCQCLVGVCWRVCVIVTETSVFCATVYACVCVCDQLPLMVTSCE